jgi:hypothetical protein
MTAHQQAGTATLSERMRDMGRIVEPVSYMCSKSFTTMAEEVATLECALTAAREPIEPDDVRANGVWDLVIQTCAQAWDETADGPTWGQSPTELIVRLIDERDAERERAATAEAALAVSNGLIVEACDLAVQRQQGYAARRNGDTVNWEVANALVEWAKRANATLPPSPPGKGSTERGA